MQPYLQAWITAMQVEQERRAPRDSFCSALRHRVGADVLGRIAVGLREGIVIEKGYRFDVKGSPDRDGFLWFSRRPWSDFELHPNWEAFVHVDYFLRLLGAREVNRASVTFENAHLDLALWQESKLWWKIEVKEKAPVARSLIQGIMQYGRGTEIRIPGGSTAKRDAIRKANRIVDHKPEFFSAVALGYQAHYKLTFQDAAHFTLDNMPPPFEF